MLQYQSYVVPRWGSGRGVVGGGGSVCVGGGGLGGLREPVPESSSEVSFVTSNAEVDQKHHRDFYVRSIQNMGLLTNLQKQELRSFLFKFRGVYDCRF